MSYKDKARQREYQEAWHKSHYVPRLRKPPMTTEERQRKRNEYKKAYIRGPHREAYLARRKELYEKKVMEKSMRNDEHGTYQRYVKGKCRCELCVDANRAYQREWQRRHNGLTPEEKQARITARENRLAERIAAALVRPAHVKKTPKTKPPRSGDYSFDGEHNVCTGCGAKLIADITPEQYVAHKQLRHN